MFVTVTFARTKYARNASCVCIETHMLDPVCASNGVTYGNPDAFECAKQCMEISSKYIFN